MRYRRLFDLRLGGRRRVDAEMDREIEAHLSMRVADLIAQGASPDAARDEAKRRFGNFDAARRRLHAGARQREATMRQRDTLRSIIADLRYAARQARRAPGFTALAVATLALGIGATTTIFTLVERVLLQPLPFPNAHQLVVLSGMDSAHNASRTISSADWLDWRKARSLQGTAIFSFPFRLGLVTTDSATRVGAVRVSANFFTVLGARFVAGRPFTERELGDQNGTVVVISERLWRQMFGANPNLSSPLRTADGASTIIGVVADGQALPTRTDVWMPVPFRPAHGAARTWLNWTAIGRLAPETTAERARAELSTIALGIHAAEPEAIYDFGVSVESLGDEITGGASSYLRMLMAAVLLLLLIVCANVAASGLARAAVRGREMAVRTSLGAPRQRLVQQLLIEHLWLGLFGGMLGLFFAWAALRGILARWGEQIPRAQEVSIDARVFAFAVVVSLAAGTLAGVVPAIRMTRVSLRSMLSSGGRTAAKGGRNLAGSSLVSLEIALALLLLTGAGLLIRSFRSVIGRDIGFDTNVATVEVALTGPRYLQDSVRRLMYWDDLIDAFRQVPGVAAVGVSQWIPLGMTGQGFIDLADRGVPNAAAVYRSVSQDFFRTLRMPLLSGRTFDAQDGVATQRVTVINKTMAEKYWPGENPLGKQVRAKSMEVRFDGTSAPWLTVIGVVGDVRTYGLETDPRPEMYAYFRQTPAWTTGMTALVRASGPAPRILGDLRRAARRVDPGVAVDITTLDDLLRSTLAERTLTMSLLTGFAGAALVLAALGIYGVLSYAVTQRTRELAVRSALGAQRGELMRLVFVAGLKVVLVGVAAGGAAAFWLTRLLESMLVDVEPIDPLTYSTSILILILVALAAIVVPARRAMRMDPIIALQAE